jgi:formiminotetrahydrofolate cyclodeaminase
MTNVGDFLSELASDSPTPGGGSVAALCGALGAALASMVCNLTVGKKKYAGVEEDMKRILGTSEALRLELTGLIDEDAAVFEKVMVAMKLPKETDEDKARRTTVLQSALVDAAMVPLAVMDKCVGVIQLSAEAAEKGNVNAVSDAGVAALVARAGAHAARLNVLINLGWINAQEHAGFKEKAGEAARDLAGRADRAAEEVMAVVQGKLS